MAALWTRVKEVVEAALEEDASDRDASVRRLCGDDAALEAEVQSLLLAISQSGRFMEGTALGSLTWRTLTPGEVFGAYEVLELLGAGGMGEVYRARDMRLNREVALKLPTAALALDIDRLERITREAHVLAALNHPHIAAIYGLEQSDGIHALVLELVDGPTLADIIATRPIPLTEALAIARQIAEGVRAAHAQGIVHSDLKPSNIKLRRDGTVKILDFGLARALDDRDSLAATEVGRTVAGATRSSLMFGTAAYMSPEQALGRRVDERSDIWAFGCVLYEMLAGHQAFGTDVTRDARASVLAVDPDWRRLPANTPRSVYDLLRWCLDKDPGKRPGDSAEVLRALDKIASRVAARNRPGRVAAGLLVGLAVLAIAAAITIPARPAPIRTTAPNVRRLLLDLPAREPLARAASMPLGTGHLALALSPDGTRVAYVLERDGARQLYLRALDEQEGLPIAGSEGAFDPFFSPDGQWVGFFAANTLVKVRASGGDLTKIAAAPNPFGGSWGSGGTILFAADEGRRLMTVPAGGGEPQPVLIQSTGGSWTRPHLLPGGAEAIVTRDRSVGVLSLPSGAFTALVENASDGRYAPTGHLTFTRDGAVFAAPFDLERHALRGSFAAVLDGVRSEGQRAVAQAAFSQEGTLIYAPGAPANSATRPVWVDRRGRVEPVGLPARRYRSLRLSPDGRQLAIVIGGPADDNIWVIDIDNGIEKQLTFGGTNVQPSWTTDGRRIVFTRRTPGGAAAFWVPADGSGPATPMFETDADGSVASFSPDGTLAAFTRRGTNTGPDVWVRPTAAAGGLRPFVQTPFTEVGPMFSPDGRWLAYVSDASGQYEVYVRAFPGPGDALQISTRGGEEALWSKDGAELFYRNGNKWMVAAVRAIPDIRAAEPRVLIEGPYVNVGGISYDVTADGRRLLLLEPAPQDPVTYLNVVLNWFEEVTRKTRSAEAAAAN